MTTNYKCIDCHETIVGTVVRAGDGTEQKFRCRECALFADIRDLRAENHNLRAQLHAATHCECGREVPKGLCTIHDKDA